MQQQIMNCILTVFITSLLWLTVGFLREVKFQQQYATLLMRMWDANDKYAYILAAYDLLNSTKNGSTSKSLRPTALEMAYKSFGLTPNCRTQEVKARFRILVKQYHPDVNKTQSASIRFKAINDAYKLIKSSR